MQRNLRRKKKLIDKSQYFNTFLSNYFDFDPITLKAKINEEKAVEKATTQTRKKILDLLLTKLLTKDEINKISKKKLK